MDWMDDFDMEKFDQELQPSLLGSILQQHKQRHSPAKSVNFSPAKYVSSPGKSVSFSLPLFLPPLTTTQATPQPHTNFPQPSQLQSSSSSASVAETPATSADVVALPTPATTQEGGEAAACSNQQLPQHMPQEPQQLPTLTWTIEPKVLPSLTLNENETLQLHQQMQQVIISTATVPLQGLSHIHRSSLWDHPCCLWHHHVYTGQVSGVVLGAPACPGKN